MDVTITFSCILVVPSVFYMVLKIVEINFLFAIDTFLLVLASWALVLSMVTIKSVRLHHTKSIGQYQLYNITTLVVVVLGV